MVNYCCFIQPLPRRHAICLTQKYVSLWVRFLDAQSNNLPKPNTVFVNIHPNITHVRQPTNDVAERMILLTAQPIESVCTYNLSAGRRTRSCCNF
jgi:hypothetical protein